MDSRRSGYRAQDLGQELLSRKSACNVTCPPGTGSVARHRRERRRTVREASSRSGRSMRAPPATRVCGSAAQARRLPFQNPYVWRDRRAGTNHARCRAAPREAGVWSLQLRCVLPFEVLRCVCVCCRWLLTGLAHTSAHGFAGRAPARKMHQYAAISSPDGTRGMFRAGRPAIAGPFGVRGCHRCGKQSQRRVRSRPRGTTASSPSLGAHSSNLRSDTLRCALVARCPERVGRSLLAGGVDNRNPPSLAYAQPLSPSIIAAGVLNADVGRGNTRPAQGPLTRLSPVSADRAVRRRGKRKFATWREGLGRGSLALQARASQMIWICLHTEKLVVDYRKLARPHAAVGLSLSEPSSLGSPRGVRRGPCVLCCSGA